MPGFTLEGVGRESLELFEKPETGLGKAEYEPRTRLLGLMTVPVDSADDSELSEDLAATGCRLMFAVESCMKEGEPSASVRLGTLGSCTISSDSLSSSSMPSRMVSNRVPALTPAAAVLSESCETGDVGPNMSIVDGCRWKPL